MKTIIFCVENFLDKNQTNDLILNYLKNNQKDNIEYKIITKQKNKNNILFPEFSNLEIIYVKSFFIKNIYIFNFFYWYNVFKYWLKAQKIIFFNPNYTLGLFPFLLNWNKKIAYFDKNVFSRHNFIYLDFFLKFCKKIITFSKDNFKFQQYRSKCINMNPFINIENIINSKEEILLPQTNFWKTIWVLVWENFIALDILLKALNREIIKQENYGILLWCITSKPPDLQIINNDKIVILNSIKENNIRSYFENIDILFIFDSKLSKIETFFQIILWIYFKKNIFITENIKYFSFLNSFWNIIIFNKHSSLDIADKIHKSKNIVKNNYTKEILNTYSNKNIIYDLQKIIENL